MHHQIEHINRPGEISTDQHLQFFPDMRLRAERGKSKRQAENYKDGERQRMNEVY